MQSGWSKLSRVSVSKSGEVLRVKVMILSIVVYIVVLQEVERLFVLFAVTFNKYLHNTVIFRL